MADLELVLLSPLKKVMRYETPYNDGFGGFSMLNNEKKSFQLFISARASEAQIDIKSDLDCIHAYKVEYLPSRLPLKKDTADDYVLLSDDGYYPDLLVPAESAVSLENGRALLWFEIEPQKNLPAGDHDITLTAVCAGESRSVSLTVKVICCPLDEQELIYTNWFHTDCLIDYYGIKAFSDEYWRIVGNFLKIAVRHGMNCVLTPLFTPPLDTSYGNERTTVQLVGVKKIKKGYKFDFSNLEKWIDLAQSCGIKYFELSHLFTQWGAHHAPKIVAEVRGKNKKIFGWKTRASSKKYRDFLTAFSAKLKEFLEGRGLKDKIFVHVSDEPNEKQLKSYTFASKMINSLFDGYKIIDTLSEYKYYENGLVNRPIVATNRIEPFIGKAPELWAYYCTGQDSNYLSNRFFAMPSQRNRVLGFQLYKYDIKGFLHWGYNFYNTRLSIKRIDPYKVTDAGKQFQSGDSFVVYPAADGTALCSLRLKVFYDGFQDLAALKTLERLAGRETALSVLEYGLDKELTFSEYPHSDKWQLETRERINAEIAKRISD